MIIAKFISNIILLSIALLAIVMSGAVAAALPAARVSVKGLSQPYKPTLLAAQRLTNRSGPNAYLDFGMDMRESKAWTSGRRV